jgi:hypothetical protein
MIRHCDGTDPNLIREILASEYDPRRDTLSSWDKAAPEGHHVICCRCGLEFDDVRRAVIWPHAALPPKLSLAEFEAQAGIPGC